MRFQPISRTIGTFLCLLLIQLGTLAQGAPLYQLQDWSSDLEKQLPLASGEPERRAAFLASINQNSELWSAILETKTDEQRKKVLNYLKEQIQKSSSLEASLRAASKNKNEILQLLAPTLQKVSTLMPISKPLDTHLVQCLQCFNGKEFIWKGAPSFALNLAYDAFGSREDLEILIAHEGFHALHLRQHDDQERELLLQTPEGNLFREGLAVYLTHLLFPRADEAKLLMMSPENLNQCIAHREDLSQRLRRERTGDPDRFTRHFFRGKASDGLPSRCGYYLGYEALKNWGTRDSIEVLSSLKHRKYANRIVERLKVLEK